MSAIDHPKHYNAHASGVECIVIVEHLDFCLGNAIKYMWRCGHKPGQIELGSDGTIEDLKKSAWYLARAVGAPHRMDVRFHDSFPLMKVIQAEALGSVLRDVLELVVVKMWLGNPPRIADALVRVELEIEKRARA